MLSGWGPGDGSRTDLPFDLAVVDELDPLLEFHDLDVFGVLQRHKLGAREGVGVGALLEIWETRSLFEEPVICSLQVLHRGLEALGVHLIEPKVFFGLFELGESSSARVVIQSLFVVEVVLLLFFEEVVIHKAGTTEVLREQDLLFVCWLKPEFEGFVLDLFHTCI